MNEEERKAIYKKAIELLDPLMEHEPNAFELAKVINKLAELSE